jgi:hypothetical protein
MESIEEQHKSVDRFVLVAENAAPNDCRSHICPKRLLRTTLSPAERKRLENATWSLVTVQLG